VTGRTDDVLTTILELTCAALLSLFLFALWPPAALLPWAALSGLMAWSRR
jgi:hypothetical protein